MKIHSTKTKCYQHSPYGRISTENDSEVTCKKCLQVLGSISKIDSAIKNHGKPNFANRQNNLTGNAKYMLETVDKFISCGDQHKMLLARVIKTCRAKSSKSVLEWKSLELDILNYLNGVKSDDSLKSLVASWRA